MAKRFIDTDIFKKGFIKSLNGAYKLLWVYIINDCNHAGIWEVDLEVAGIRCGFQYDYETAKSQFGDKIVVFDGGAKWFIPSFIDFQYGELNEKNRVHASILLIHKKYNLTKNKPLTSPLQGAKDKDKDKDKDKEGGGVGETPLAMMQRIWVDAGLFCDESELMQLSEIAIKITGKKDLAQLNGQLTQLEAEWRKIVEYVKDNTKFYGSFASIVRNYSKIKNDIGKPSGRKPVMAEIITNNKYRQAKLEQEQEKLKRNG